MRVNGFIYQLCMFNFWGLEKARSLPEDYCSLFCSCLYSLILMGGVALIGSGTILWAGVFFFEDTISLMSILGQAAMMLTLVFWGFILIMGCAWPVVFIILCVLSALSFVWHSFGLDKYNKPSCGKIEWKR